MRSENWRKCFCIVPLKELLNLTPDTLEELLFDDIPYLKVAAIEHDYFSEILRREGG